MSWLQDVNPASDCFVIMDADMTSQVHASVWAACPSQFAACTRAASLVRYTFAKPDSHMPLDFQCAQ